MTDTHISNQHGASPAPTGGTTTTTDRPARRGIWLAILLVVPLSAAACGSGSNSANVAHLGSTASSPTARATSGASLETFAACMRSHGVSQFPDPINNGTSLRLQVGPGGVDPESAQYQSALGACSSLAPNGVVGELAHTITPAQQLDYVKAAACVRAHGVARFPDPTITDGHVKFVLPPGVNTDSPQDQAAIATCRKLIPAGLPYSK